MVDIPKRVVDVFFLSFIFFFGIFGFWSLVSNCRVTRVAHGVLLWSLGWGYIQHGGKFCPRLNYRYMLPFLIDEMGGGMEG